MLCWFKDGTGQSATSRDAKISIATAYQYLHEAIAAHAPDLPDVLARALRDGWEFMCLVGTVIPGVRSSRTSEAAHDLQCCASTTATAPTSRFLTGPDGYPEGVSPAEPGSTHDITASGNHALPALSRPRRMG